MAEASIVVALVTTPVDQARMIARILVERGAVACVNVLPPVHSIFRWQGDIEETEESLLVIKTTSEAVNRLETLLREVHPYEVFELVVLPVQGGNPDYMGWVADSVP